MTKQDQDFLIFIPLREFIVDSTHFRGSA